MPDSFAVSLQYLLPKQALTVLAGKIASARAGWFTTALVRAFVSHYDVDMTEAEHADTGTWKTVWRLLLVTACTHHGTVLVAGCSSCGRPFRDQRGL